MMVWVRVMRARVVLFGFEGVDIAGNLLGSSWAVSCFSRSTPMPSGRDGEGEVEDEEEDAIRLAIFERPQDPTYVKCPKPMFKMTQSVA